MIALADMGRGASAIRTPLLVRAYLAGLVPFPEDTAQQRRRRREGGDYISRIHRRVKLRIRAQDRQYKYPRAQSFKTFIENLILLGLVEKTGRREPGKLQVNEGFESRTWVKIVPAMIDSDIWQDPMGHLRVIYPNLSRIARVPEIPTAQAFVPSPTPQRRRRAAAEPTAGQELLSGLEEQRELLRTRARELSVSGTHIDSFESLLEDTRAFMYRLDSLYRRNPLSAVSDPLGLLENCVRLYREALAGGRNPERELVNCQAAARILAEELQTPIREFPDKLGPAPAPTPVPHVEIGETQSAKGVSDLKAHLALLEAHGVERTGASFELNLLIVQVGRWLEHIQTQLVEENAKPNPRRQGIRTFDKRFTALDKVTDEMGTRDLPAAIESLDEAFPS